MKVEVESPAGTILKVWAAFASLFWYFWFLVGGLLGLAMVPLIGLGILHSGKALCGLNDTLRYLSGGVGFGLLAVLGARANDWLWHDDDTRKKLEGVAGKVTFWSHELAAILILFAAGPVYVMFLLGSLLKQVHGLPRNPGPLTRLPEKLAARLSWVGLVCGCLWLTTTLYAYVHYPLVTFDTRPPAKITVDGQELGMSPIIRPLMVGQHRLKLEPKGQPPTEEELQVPMGGLTYNKRVRTK